MRKSFSKSYIFEFDLSIFVNHLGGVMVSVSASSAGDRGSIPGRVKPKTLKLVFAASPPGTRH